MTASLRAGLLAALVAFACAFSVAAFAADKSFENAELADAAVKLEAQIKTDAGAVTKNAATLRRDSDAAFQKKDLRGGMQVLGQLVTAAPNDAAAWLRLARTVSQIKPRDDKERAFFLDRASSAAYIAYQRSTTPNDEADSLAVLGNVLAERKIYRPALDAMRIALTERENATLRAQYETLRASHGFRMLDYTIDSDAMSPRTCFQFSEELPRKTDFSPFVAVAGVERPAISATEKQLCVEGLKHGERYAITLRAGLPSVVHESLAKSADFTIYVRDRKPFARFAGKAYVLPKTGQRGLPVLSVNSSAVNIAIYRIGDRNLMYTLASDFQQTVNNYSAEQLASEKGSKIWSGELAVEPKLNTEVTTAFPVNQAAGELKPGVYVMTASPKEAPANDYGQLATQWFIVSDLGLTAYSTTDGVDAFVHSLASAQVMAGVELRLVARNNEVLATKRTDSSGFVHFDSGLTRGDGGQAPAAIVAVGKDDYAFLNLRAPAFDLTDRGVGGRPAPAAVDAFVYTERGVYRSGETVHITALLRDAHAVAVTGPLTLVMERPDGVEYKRAIIGDQGLGGRSLSVPLNAAAASGTWRVRAFTDPKRPAVGETTFMVEDYVPDRLEFDLSSSATSLSRDGETPVAIAGHYLYGAPAGDLSLEGEVTISAAKERAGFPGYSFGPADEEVTATRQQLEDLPSTDEQGKASFDIALDDLPDTARPLTADISVRMAEAGGRAVERRLSLPIAAAGPMIGIKPNFSGRSLADGANASFDVVQIAPDDKPLARKGLRYELLRIETRYQWYRQNGSWEFEPIKTTSRVADGTFDYSGDTPAKLSLPVRWGRYRIEVSTGEADGPLTSLQFDAGFYAESSADTPDLLEIALDKRSYKAGDTMTVSATARTDGELTINVVADRLAFSETKTVKAGAVTVPVKVGTDWGSGAYVVATLRRPLDAPAQRMPGRAIGVQWFAVDRAAHSLTLDLKLPQTMRPNGRLSIPVKVGGLAAGEEARLVVAAVDVGILNLTNYKPPAPDDYFLGQRKLAADIRDLYGQLIDGMQGAAGRIRSGGDMAGAELSGSPPAQAPLALYSGIVPVGPDGTAQVDFDIPAFAGTVRVMAIGWSKAKVGKATGDVIVRDPVVLTTTLPRFLRTGDSATVQIDIDNVEGPAGEYALDVSSNGSVKTSETSRKATLAAKQRLHVALPLTASAAGTSVVSVSLRGPNDLVVSRDYPIGVRPATQILARRTVKPLAKGETLTLSEDMFADLAANTGRVSVSVSISTALDAAALLNALDRYPFGCSEQITSRAVALLYANELAQEARLNLDDAIDERIRNGIASLLARQGANGSFGLWSAGGDDAWLDAYVTDFLTRARERKFEVPDAAFKLALDRLRNYVAVSQDPKRDGGRNLAYALYVLARNGLAPVGDLRYFADVKLAEFTTPIAKAQIAAALAMLGDKGRAQVVYTAALQSIAPKPEVDIGRTDFGSALRDSAALVTLASESGATRATIDGAVQRIDAARGLTRYISTQEQAWLVLAARALNKETSAIALAANGEAHKGAFYRSLKAGQLSAPLTLANTGEGTVQAVVTVSGAPVTPEPSASQGFKIERKYYTLDGEPADPGKAKQNDRFAVVLTVTDEKPQFARVMLADYLPAGFEIDNPHLVSSGDANALPWIKDGAEAAHAEFKDDRFAAAFERQADSPAVFTAAYVVRAVTPGKYVLPQAVVEDMYRPDRFGRTATGTIEVSAR
ncbi:MAG TPA: alpha-2-macroglobulin [Pseudolabrys sp.]|nr:alpha-2-macroglobulin [Pseudolabrys sp.]